MTRDIDVFISYKREERHLTDRVLTAIQAAGYTAVTDLNITRNTDFSDAIDAMIREARLTLVLWTVAAAKSPWVRKEAKLAYDLEQAGKPNCYLGVVFAGADIEMPVALRGLQMVPVAGADPSEAEIAQIVAQVRDILGAETSAEIAQARSKALAEEFQLFEWAAATNVRAGYEAYLRAYPNGEFATEAHRQLRMYRRWYLHPFRRGNLNNTLTALSIVVAAGAAYGSLKSTGIDPKEHEKIVSALEDERDTAQTLAQDRQTRIAGLEVDLGEALGVVESRETQIVTLVGEAQKAVADYETQIKDLNAALAGHETQAAEHADEVAGLTDQLATAHSNLTSALADRDAAIAHLEKERDRAVSAGPPPLDCPPEAPTGYLIAGDCVPASATVLNLNGKKYVSGFSKVAGLTNLANLYANNSSVADLSPLSGLTSLTLLSVYHSTPVSDLHPLSGLTNLSTLSFSGTSVTDLSPLKDLKNLTYLAVSGTKVTDLSPLKNLPNLTTLWDPDGAEHKGRTAVKAAIEKWPP